MVANDDTYVVQESVVSPGLGRSNLSLLQSASAGAAWKSGAGIIWALFTHESGAWSWPLAGAPTHGFYVACSSSQYGDWFQKWVSQERAKLTLYCLLWPSHRSHGGCFFSIPFVQEVTAAFPGLQEEEIDSTSWSGDGGSGRQCRPGIMLWPLLKNAVCHRS